MLIRLKIQNLILVDKADIVFEPGLNIITGETGAGKSAILSAIRLLAGNRSDSQLIGKNGSFAIIEAFLSTYLLPEELTAPPEGEPLRIRREIHPSGKNRCFANDQQISLAVLRQIVGSTIELVDQSSAQTLCSIEEQRRMLDLFGNTLHDAKMFERSFAEEREIQQCLDHLLQAAETRNRDLAWLEEDLRLFDAVHWQMGEEESLSQEHHLLTHSQELLDKMNTLSGLLEDPCIKRALFTLNGCAKLDPSLAPLTTQLQNANCEIEDVRATIHSYVTRLEANPSRLSFLEERMAKIDQIKRRFGKTWDLAQEKKKELLHRVELLQNLEEKCVALQSSLQKKQEENRYAAAILSEKRKQGANHFSKTILKELQTLNLPHAQFIVSVRETEVTSCGSNSTHYLFSANAGHMPIPIEQCASGGELSRLLFSIKLALVNKEKTDCLIFDEIDSNIGGQTATILGEKLKAIAQDRQVICITHFVQVARFAMAHFAVAKHEQEGKTLTSISKLTKQTKEQEYERMLGRSSFAKNFPNL